MKLVVGLGNPGPRYAQTRHNAGFAVLDRLAIRHGWPFDHSPWLGDVASGCVDGTELTLLKPTTYMNASGESVALAVAGVGVAPPDVIVALDDLDLPEGAIRLRKGGGPGGQRGLASILEALETTDVARLRVGIGRPPEGVDPVDWVLGEPGEEAAKRLVAAVDRAASAIETFVVDGIDVAMNRFNVREHDPERSLGG